MKPGKLDELNCVLQKIQKVHIVAITETWIKTEAEAQSLVIPNYTHYFNYRVLNRGGGVSLYIHNDLKHELVEEKCQEDNHFLWVHVGKFSLDVGLIYKPERTNTSLFLQTLSEQLQQRKRGILFGDFNYNLLKKEPNIKEYKTTLRESGYTIINKIGKDYCTRETSHTKSILDHVCTNLLSHHFHLAIIESAMSDHNQIYFEIQRQQPIPIQKMEYDQINYGQFCKSLKDSIENSNLNNDYERLEKLLITTICENKTRKIKVLNPPKKDWINGKITAVIDERNAAWRKMLDNPNDETAKQGFLEERKKTMNMINVTKSEYYHKAFMECKEKPMKMWNLINQLSCNKIRHNNTSFKLLIKSELITDEQKVCDHFNDFFSNIGSLLAKQIQDKYHSNITTPNKNQCTGTRLSYLRQTTIDEINKIIDNLKSNSSAGIDGISAKILKSAKNMIVGDLSNCINKCLELGVFPDSLKIAKVSPIFKAGDKSDPGNYRPISVLPVISKIFEKVLYIRLIEHLDSVNFLFKGQYGFRSKSSTLSATIDLITKIKTNIDEKQLALGVFIDLKKAFDTVSHPLLIDKLDKITGVTGTALKMFKSYLNNRYQIVKIGQCKSSPKLVTFGPSGLHSRTFTIFDLHQQRS